MTTHTIPAIERAVEVLDALSRNGGASITTLTADLAIPRSTVYRVLNSLERSDLVRRERNGCYVLGAHILRLAQAVTVGLDLVAMARPLLDALSAELGMTAKLSVLDGPSALVVAVAEGPGSYTVSTQVGRRFPLHAGAASKVLLAYAPPEIIEAVLVGPLEGLTPSTIREAAALEAALEETRRIGFSEDHSEFAAGINAIAAPVFSSTGDCAAAVSVPFLAHTPPDIVDRIRSSVRECASSASRVLGGR